MLKNTTRLFAKRYAPEFITHYKKKSITGQQTLFASTTPTISWKIETTKLVELTTALSECNAFGSSVSRKEIWEVFSTTFDVNLSNAEKVLSQMKYRNNTPVRFIQELHDNFLLLMNGK